MFEKKEDNLGMEKYVFIIRNNGSSEVKEHFKTNKEKILTEPEDGPPPPNLERNFLPKGDESEDAILLLFPFVVSPKFGWNKFGSGESVGGGGGGGGGGPINADKRFPKGLLFEGGVGGGVCKPNIPELIKLLLLG